MRCLAAGIFVALWCSTSAAQSDLANGVAVTERKDDPAAVRGRKNKPDAGAGAAWVPRILFAPITLVTEFGIRQPTNAIADWSVRNHVPEIISDIVLKPTPDIRWYPLVSMDVGYYYAAGAAIEFDNLLVRDHTFKLQTLVGGPDFFQVVARDTWKAGLFHLSLNGRGFTRSDRAFYGFGPYSNDVKTNFAQTRFEGFATAALDVKNHLHLAASEGFRSDRNAPGPSPSIESLFTTASIPGFSGTDLAMAMFDARLDSRHDVEDTSGGVRLAANVTYGRDVHDSERSFVSTRADLEAAIEVMKPDRVLTFRGFVSDSVPLGTEPVPFLEQSMLGWENHNGFHWGRFRDNSAVMFEVRYRYPIAYFIDMQWGVSVGNVFAKDFSDFDAKAMTTSITVGFRTRRTGRTPLRLLVGVGTTRFDQAFNIESVRLYVSNAEDL